MTVRSLLFTAAVCGAILTGCDRPKGAPPPESTPAPAPVVAPPPRPPEPVKWDEASGRFTLDGVVMKTAYLWRFDGSLEGFSATGAAAASAPDGGLLLTEQILDSVLRSPQNLAIQGGRYNAVVVRLTRQKAAAKWDGSLFYVTPAHGETAEFHAKPLRASNPVPGETMVMVYDMANPKKGGDDWVSSTISGLRLDFDDSADGAFLIHQIAVVSLPAPSALRPPQ